MITFKARKNRNGRKSRGWSKFPRGTKRIKNFEGTYVRMRYPYWYGYGTITTENLKRFLLANVGRPVNKVYSEFLKRCDSSVYDPKYKFFRRLKKKEEIDSRWGGFYVTNGILNYKKRKKPTTRKTISYADLNEQSMPEKSRILEICKQAERSQKAVFLGRFYVYACPDWNYRLASVYVIPTRINYLTRARNVTVVGIGVGITLFEEACGYKPKTQVEFVMRDSSLQHNTDTYEFITKEK